MLVRNVRDVLIGAKSPLGRAQAQLLGPLDYEYQKTDDPLSSQEQP